MIPTRRKTSRAKCATGAPTASAHGGAKRLVNRPYLNRSKGKPYGITIYEGGNLVQLSVPKFKSKITYDEGRNRGKISDYSYKSRQRMMRKQAMIDRRAAGLPVFLTLTYPEEWPGDAKEWKAQLHHFKVYMTRRFKDVWGLWKMEFQKRGAPHFHLMLWGLPKIQGTEHVREGKLCWRVLPGISRAEDLEVFNWFNETWYRIVGSEDEKHLAAGVNLEPVQSWQGVSSYVSKYLGKVQGGEFVPVEHTGRFWGVIQGQKWQVKKLVFEIGEEGFIKYRRQVLKMYRRAAKQACQKAKAEGKKKPAWAVKRSWSEQIPVGISWYLDSLMGIRLVGWAAE